MQPIIKNEMHCTSSCQGTADIMSLLLDHGTNIHSVDMDKRTPLHLSIIVGAVKYVQILLAAGTNPNAIDAAPTEDISNYQPLKELELSIDKGRFQGSSLHLAVRGSNKQRLLEMTRLLLEAGANVFGRNFNGETCLQIAAKEGNVTSMEELICANNYGNIYLGIKDNSEKSTRDCAEQMSHALIVELLGNAEKERLGSCYSRAAVIPELDGWCSSLKMLRDETASDTFVFPRHSQTFLHRFAL
jgi:hypothetical protein